MTEPVQCLTCSRFDLRGAPAGLARSGFGRCAKQSKSEFVSIVYHRACGWHAPAEPAVVSKRRAWVENRRP